MHILLKNAVNLDDILSDITSKEGDMLLKHKNALF